MDVDDYPLGERRPELVTTPRGTPLTDVTLDALLAGRVVADELRATPETLRRQADVARAAGRAPLGDNLARAAELASVPDDVILDVYTALRPHRSTEAELRAWARRLADEYGAHDTAAFVDDACAVYAARGLFAS